MLGATEAAGAIVKGVPSSCHATGECDISVGEREPRESCSRFRAAASAAAAAAAAVAAALAVSDVMSPTACSSSPATHFVLHNESAALFPLRKMLFVLQVLLPDTYYNRTGCLPSTAQQPGMLGEGDPSSLSQGVRIQADVAQAQWCGAVCASGVLMHSCSVC